MPSLIGSKPNQISTNGDLGTLAFQDASNVSVGSVTYSGNINFTGTGNRITGDFSNGTIANQVIFQTSTTNGNTTVYHIPNGTGNLTSVVATNSSDVSATSTGAVAFIQANATDGRLGVGRLSSSGSFLPLTMYTGGSERLRIDTSGNVGIGLTPTSRNNTRLQIVDGIGFPATQVASSDANTLDDYEEGTWTPVLSRDVTAPSISYLAREGKYTKIGNMVTCWISINSITVSSAGSGANIITGLPFAIGNQTYGGMGGFGYNDAFTNTVYGVVTVGGQTQVYFRGGARSSGNDSGGWSSSGYLGLTFTYFTS